MNRGIEQRRQAAEESWAGRTAGEIPVITVGTAT